MKDNTRKRYSEAFKKEAVMRVLGQDTSAHSISRQLGISQPTLSKWVRRFKQDGASVFGQGEVLDAQQCSKLFSIPAQASD